MAFHTLQLIRALSNSIGEHYLFKDKFNGILSIGECPSIAPFLENNGPRPRKGPRSIVFKEWNDTRTFAYVKSTQQLQPLPRYM